MKRRTLMALLGACVLAVAAPAVMAEETELNETEVETEAETEAAAQTWEERPDYVALDYVALGEYIGLEIEVSPIDVSDDEVLEEVMAVIEAAGVTEEGETIEEGDVVNIDYTGYQDGEAFDGGSAEGYDLTIGSGTFIDGFEEGLVGVAVGETVDLELTFPEDYYYTDLAGVEVVFTVTVNSISRTPELSDEVVSEATDGVYTDVDSFEAYVREYLEEDAEDSRQSEIQELLLSALAANSEIIDYPEDLVAYSVQDGIDYYTEMAEYYSMDYESFITAFGYTEESFLEALTASVKSGLEEELLLMAVAEAEGMELTDEQYEAGLLEYTEYYGYSSTEDFYEAYTTYYSEKLLRMSILMDNVFVYLQDNAVITEAAVEVETELNETELETE